MSAMIVGMVMIRVDLVDIYMLFCGEVWWIVIFGGCEQILGPQSRSRTDHMGKLGNDAFNMDED